MINENATDTVEMARDGAWRIDEFSSAFKLLAVHPEYIMAVLPSVSRYIENGQPVTYLARTSVEVYFWKNNHGSEGDEVTERQVIGGEDIDMDTTDKEWWTEFAERYGDRFSKLPKETIPASLFEQTFPDIVEKRNKKKNQPSEIQV